MLQYLKSYHTFQLLPKLIITLKYLVGFCYCLHYHHAISQLSCIILGVFKIFNSLSTYYLHCWQYHEISLVEHILLTIIIAHLQQKSSIRIKASWKNSELTLKFWRHVWHEERRIAGKKVSPITMLSFVPTMNGQAISFRLHLPSASIGLINTSSNFNCLFSSVEYRLQLYL